MAYRKRGDSWLVDVYVHGVRRYKTVKSEDLAKIAEKELELEGLKEGGAKPAAPSLLTKPWTLKEALDSCLGNHWKGTKSELFYKRTGAQVVKHFGADVPLSSITTELVDAYRLTLEEAELARATINHRLITLGVIFKEAIKRSTQSGVTLKPHLGIKEGARGRIRWLSATEETVLVALLTQWGKTDMLDYAYVLMDTGMRPSEALALNAHDIDFRTKLVSVWDAKTEAGVRSLPMTKRVQEVLERRCMAFKQGPVFPYKLTTLQVLWRNLRRAMKLGHDEDFVLYCLRHTFATRLVQRGVRIEVIKELLGHSSLDQTMQYAHLGAHQYVDAIRALETLG